jgi:hypothetical protein
VSRRRLLIWAVILVNTVPFAPFWPDSSGGDGFVADWIILFLVVSLPIWVAVVVLWLLLRGRPAAQRCVIAELPGLIQIGLWFGGYIEVVAVLLAVRLVDGFLLFRLSSQHPSTRMPARLSESA